jgi:hypothetical protein
MTHIPPGRRSCPAGGIRRGRAPGPSRESKTLRCTKRAQPWRARCAVPVAGAKNNEITSGGGSGVERPAGDASGNRERERQEEPALQ